MGFPLTVYSYVVGANNPPAIKVVLASFSFRCGYRHQRYWHKPEHQKCCDSNYQNLFPQLRECESMLMDLNYCVRNTSFNTW